MDRSFENLNHIMKKLPFGVPDGYFDSLHERLSSVCRAADTGPAVSGKESFRSSAPSRRPVRSIFMYTGIAAGLAVVAVCGLILSGGNLRLWDGGQNREDVFDVSGLSADEIYDRFLYSDLIPESAPDLFFSAYGDEELSGIGYYPGYHSSEVGSGDGSEDGSEVGSEVGSGDMYYDDALAYLIYSGITPEEAVMILDSEL